MREWIVETGYNLDDIVVRKLRAASLLIEARLRLGIIAQAILVSFLFGVIFPNPHRDVVETVLQQDLSFWSSWAYEIGLDVTIYLLCVVMLKLARQKLDPHPEPFYAKIHGDGTWAWGVILSIAVEMCLFGWVVHTWGGELRLVVSPLGNLSLAYCFFIFRHSSGGKRRRRRRVKTPQPSIFERLFGLPAPNS